jgi:hypothetical protein
MFLRRLSGPGKGITSSPVWFQAVFIRQIHSVPASCLLNICSARCCDVFFTRSSSAVLNYGFITVPHVSPVISSLRRIPIGTGIIYIFLFTLFLYSRIGKEKNGSRKYHCPLYGSLENSYPGPFKKRALFSPDLTSTKSIGLPCPFCCPFRSLRQNCRERRNGPAGREKIYEIRQLVFSRGPTRTGPSAFATAPFRGVRPRWSAFPSMGTDVI